MEQRSHVAEPFLLGEINAEDKVGTGHGLLNGLGILVVAHNALSPGHPLEEIGEHIRHADEGLLALAAQIAGQSQRGTDGITVRTAMGADDDTLGIVDQLHQTVSLFDSQNVYIHTG